MDQGLSKTIETDDVLDVAPSASSTTLGVITLRFILLLMAIVAIFAWAWSR